MINSGWALRCCGIDKDFPLRRNLSVWRLLVSTGELSGDVVQALRGVSLDVPAGRIVGILGKNGAGKSTLLRVLGGVYEPTRGRLEVNGRVTGLFELGGMGNPQLTGRDYADRYLRLVGGGDVNMPAALDEIQEFSELGESFDRRINTYSSGMAARLYFAVATTLPHDIYLIDELLSVGDEHFQAKCHLRMRQLLGHGASGVLVTHDWAAVLRLCEEARVMEQGRLVFAGPSDKAVVSYLGIEPPAATQARIASTTAAVHHGTTGQDLELVIWVDVVESTPVELSASFEMLQVGRGWEIVLLTRRTPVGEAVGRYEVVIDVPALPLAPGTYSLNLFLTRRPESTVDATTVLDSRTWTLGNGLTLHVDGPPLAAAVDLPFVARALTE